MNSFCVSANPSEISSTYLPAPGSFRFSFFIPIHSFSADYL
ncbi:hypothetical protein B4135_3884 [Caldibacillus debilis]|uniref:Uncharacterized protein n=1 Tax=Caldibacillus debilis TaxID=301148 RepID=A0A150L9E4_9BACI|nr:hypothetical protein B4135_3884 [Caldibacillus debilis]